MDKGKSFNNEQATTVEALGASIVDLLLQEGKVIIPESGYLELKKFPDKQTVLFKATENATLFLASEGSIQSEIYNRISVPLKEGKVITLPELGIFRSMKNEDGSCRISFTISSALRNLLNGTNEVKPSNLPLTPGRVADEKTDDSKETEEKKAIQIKEARENKIENKATERKEQGTVTSAPPRREIHEDWKTPSPGRTKVGDLVVPQEEKGRYVTGLGKIIAAIAALIVLAFVVWTFLSENRNENSRSESTRMINQSDGSAKHESIDLPSLAERKYGNRIFWVYIYQANRDKISSPVNIPPGTNLRMPDLWEDFKVDVMDSLEIKRAGILSDIILKQKLQL